MLTVEDYELIRRKLLVDKQSIRAIAKELGHSRKTVAKAARHAQPPGYQRTTPRAKPAIDAYRPIIDAWLAQDESRPRKQRHTAARVFERLRDEHGYTGSEVTVRRYVASRRPKPSEVFVPLSFAPGEEAQVDWGEASVIVNGRERKVQLFCVRLAHSRHAFVRAYERTNMESFLDGHVRAFEFFGGVPRRLAYDNLKTAVIEVGRGRNRRLNEQFVTLRSWYLFDTRFCNVQRGNEKGHVENQVKRAQRKFLTPLPEVTDLEQLNAKLEEDCRRELQRVNADGQPRADSFAAEQSRFLQLPPDCFPACQQRSTDVDKQALVHFDRHMYSVPVEWAHHPCQLRGFVDRVEIVCEQQIVASHPRSYADDPYVLDHRHYLPVLERKPGLLDQGRPFQGDPWGDDFRLLRRELEYRWGADGTRHFIRVLLLWKTHSEQDVRNAVAQCVARRIFSVDAIVAALRDEPVCAPSPRLDLSHHPEFAAVGDGVRSAAIYDELTRQQRQEAMV